MYILGAFIHDMREFQLYDCYEVLEEAQSDRDYMNKDQNKKKWIIVKELEEK